MTELITAVTRARTRGATDTGSKGTPADGFADALNGALGAGGDARQSASFTSSTATGEHATHSGESEPADGAPLGLTPTTDPEAEPVSRAAASAFALLTERGAWQRALGLSAGIIDDNPARGLELTLEEVVTGEAPSVAESLSLTEPTRVATAPQVPQGERADHHRTHAAAGEAAGDGAVVQPEPGSISMSPLPSGVDDSVTTPGLTHTALPAPALGAAPAQTVAAATVLGSVEAARLAATPSATAPTTAVEAGAGGVQGAAPTAGTARAVTSATPSVFGPLTPTPVESTLASPTAPAEPPSAGSGAARPEHAGVLPAASATDPSSALTTTEATTPGAAQRVLPGQAQMAPAAPANSAATPRTDAVGAGVAVGADAAAGVPSTADRSHAAASAPVIGASPATVPASSVTPAAGATGLSASHASAASVAAAPAPVVAAAAQDAPAQVAASTVPNVPESVAASAATEHASGKAPAQAEVDTELGVAGRGTARPEAAPASPHAPVVTSPRLEVPLVSAEVDADADTAPHTDAPESSTSPATLTSDETVAADLSGRSSDTGTGGNSQGAAAPREASRTDAPQVGVERTFATAQPASVNAGQPTPPAASAPPMHTQIMQGLTPMLRGQDGSHQVTLQLAPAHLGRVDITLEVRAGEVTVMMRAADGAARELLRDNVDQLRQQLADMGLRPGSVDVDSGSHSDGGQTTWQQVADAQARAQRAASNGDGTGFPGDTTDYTHTLTSAPAADTAPDHTSDDGDLDVRL